MSKKNKKYFVVWEGREPGVYANWTSCKRQVDEYPNARFKGFATEAEACKAFFNPYEEYVGKNKKPPTLDTQLLEKFGKPITESISVDAACSGNPGKMEYRGVNSATGEQLFYQGVFPNATNNIGEFLAIVHALAMLKKMNSSLPVYSDSLNALIWVKNRKCRTKLIAADNNIVVFQLIARAENWLVNNDYSNPVLKWETMAWGEIPADFGRK
jgi:ribonuclease HI